VSCGVTAAMSFEEEPGTPLCFVDPIVSGGKPYCEQEGTRRRKFQTRGILRAKEIRIAP